MVLYRYNGKLLRTAGGLAGHERCCCGPQPIDCVRCLNGLAPPNLLVRIEGLANNVCTACADYNTTYSLPFVLAGGGLGGACSAWYLEMTSGPCGVASPFRDILSVRFLEEFNVLTVQLQIRGPLGQGTQVNWNKDYDGLPDCMAWNEEAITEVAVIGTGNRCIATGSAAYITAA